MTKRSRALVALSLALFALAGCYLVSGQQIESTPPEGNRAGVYTVRFVGAEGQSYQQVATGLPIVLLDIEVLATTEAGQLIVEVLDAGGAPVMTATARLGHDGRARGLVRTDSQGQVTLRLQATEARDGTYTVRYRPADPPTPTPTPTITPTPRVTPVAHRDTP